MTLPVSVKLSPYFSSTANLAKLLVDEGASGLVLFNRFYQPDIDLETLGWQFFTADYSPTLRLPPGIHTSQGCLEVANGRSQSDDDGF